MKYEMKKTEKYQAKRRLRKENEYKEPLSSPVPRTRENLEASVASRFFYCPEVPFTLYRTLYKLRTFVMKPSMRCALTERISSVK